MNTSVVSEKTVRTRIVIETKTIIEIQIIIEKITTIIKASNFTNPKVPVPETSTVIEKQPTVVQNIHKTYSQIIYLYEYRIEIEIYIYYYYIQLKQNYVDRINLINQNVGVVKNSSTELPKLQDQLTQIETKLKTQEKTIKTLKTIYIYYIEIIKVFIIKYKIQITYQQSIIIVHSDIKKQISDNLRTELQNQTKSSIETQISNPGPATLDQIVGTSPFNPVQEILNKPTQIFTNNPATETSTLINNTVQLNTQIQTLNIEVKNITNTSLAALPQNQIKVSKLKTITTIYTYETKILVYLQVVIEIQKIISVKKAKIAVL